MEDQYFFPGAKNPVNQSFCIILGNDIDNTTFYSYKIANLEVN